MEFTLQGFTQTQLIMFVLLLGLLFFSLFFIFRLKKSSLKQDSTSLKPKPLSLKSILNQKLDELILKTKTLDPQFLDSLEELLYTSDLGPKTVDKLLTHVRAELSRGELKDPLKVKTIISQKIFETLNVNVQSQIKTKPHVILIVGVNGVGKTTSIGKLAYHYSQQGKKTMVVAADTFRAAAGDQLNIWAKRAEVSIYTSTQTQDPAAVAYQGLEKAIKEQSDVVIIDTAGRLHNKENLMEELKKVKRVIQKILPEAPHQILLVIDANSGQNALVQARQFNEALKLTGLVVTKLDGTAKGGIIVGIADELGVLPSYIGVGEKITDFKIFSAQEFSKALIF
ncbi:MAG: signal recognition particle-docking protein FtsY [Oligoflexia bacterium]|nr:signal recognition particle-docking protein FtsY [Oligoflexia bacterium]